MNSVIEQIHQHKSIRKYKDQEISDDILNTVLSAATRASSSGNMQAYSIIVTRDQKLKEKLYPLHFEQSMVLEAPVMLTFCADFSRMRKWLELSDAPMNFDNFMSFMIAAIDAILASSQAAIAAESLGLGLCYMGTTLANAHLIGEVLNCPSHVVPVVGFSLGYPDEEIAARDRLPLTNLVHQETYRHYSDEQIALCYKKREVDGLKRYEQNPDLKKKMQEHNVHQLAQVYTKIKYTRSSHLEYSKNLFNYLKKQNFLNFD